MEEGRAVEIGRHDEFLAAEGRYAELFELQAGACQQGAEAQTALRPGRSGDGMGQVSRSILGQRFQSYSLKTLPEPASAQDPPRVPPRAPSQPSHLPLGPQKPAAQASGGGASGSGMGPGRRPMCADALTR